MFIKQHLCCCHVQNKTWHAKSSCFPLRIYLLKYFEFKDINSVDLGDLGFSSDLLDSNLEHDEEVFVEFGTSISPCLVKSVENNEYVYMILPIRLKE